MQISVEKNDLRFSFKNSNDSFYRKINHTHTHKSNYNSKNPSSNQFFTNFFVYSSDPIYAGCKYNLLRRINNIELYMFQYRVSDLIQHKCDFKNLFTRNERKRERELTAFSYLKIMFDTGRKDNCHNSGEWSKKFKN